MKKRSLLKKLLYKWRKCIVCKRKFRLKYGYSDEICSEKCYKKYLKMLEEAREIKPKKARVCLACGIPIRNGHLCQNCFIEIGTKCIQLGLKPVIAEVWKLRKTSSGTLLKEKVKTIRLVR